MNVLLVSATIFEIAKTIEYLEKNFEQKSFSEFAKNEISVFPFVTGVGSPLAAFAMARLQDSKKYNLIIHAGLSGAYNKELMLTDVVEVVSEQFADLGAEEKDGSFIDLFELNLLSEDQFPFQEKKLNLKKIFIESNLKKVKGLTVNKVSGTQESINKLMQKYNADVESMEGAAIFYACRMMNLPFVSIRAISNYVEPRNKNNWKLDEAIENLNRELIKMIEHF